MSEAPAGALPGLAEALSWKGSEIDDVGGSDVGRVIGVYVDAEAGVPVWLIVSVPASGWRPPFVRRRAKAVIVPLRECAAMPSRVWTAQDRGAIRAAPAVDTSRPLLREHELTICLHYGIGEGGGRHAEVAARPAASITAQPV